MRDPKFGYHYLWFISFALIMFAADRAYTMLKRGKHKLYLWYILLTNKSTVKQRKLSS